MMTPAGWLAHLRALKIGQSFDFDAARIAALNETKINNVPGFEWIVDMLGDTEFDVTVTEAFTRIRRIA